MQLKNVLWEAEHDGENIFGFTENYIRVKTVYDPLLVNTITPVFLKELDATGESVHTEIEDYAQLLNSQTYSFLTLDNDN